MLLCVFFFDDIVSRTNCALTGMRFACMAGRQVVG